MAHGFRRSGKGLPGQLCLDGTEDNRAASFLATPYSVVEQLLAARPQLAGQVAVEPCAGNGALIRHAARACAVSGYPAIQWRTAIELRDERVALTGLAQEVLSPQDTTQLTGAQLTGVRDVGVTLALTNLPWFRGVIPICRAVWRLWPRAELWGLCSTFFYLGTEREDRAGFLREHRPEEILHLPRRVRFEGARAGYNQPLAWHRWLPGGHRGAGRWDMLVGGRP